jgi:hypothetical protein
MAPLAKIAPLRSGFTVHAPDLRTATPTMYIMLSLVAQLGNTPATKHGAANARREVRNERRMATSWRATLRTDTRSLKAATQSAKECAKASISVFVRSQRRCGETARRARAGRVVCA